MFLTAVSWSYTAVAVSVAAVSTGADKTKRSKKRSNVRPNIMQLYLRSVAKRLYILERLCTSSCRGTGVECVFFLPTSNGIY